MDTKNIWVLDDIKSKIGLIWFLFLLALFLIFITGSILITSNLIISREISSVHWWLKPLGMSLLSICLLGFFIQTIRKGFVQVESSYEYVIELFGKNLDKAWVAGLHIAFPWFNVVKIKSIIYMGTRRVKLFNPDDPNDKIDFKDDSAPVDATLLWRVIDATTATYETEDLGAVVKDVVDGCLRSFLGQFKLDDANKHKFLIDKQRILNNVGELDPKKQDETPAENANDEALVKSTEIESYLKERGAEIEKISVNDIGLSTDSEKARRKILVSEADAEAAKYEKIAMIERGKGEAKANEVKETAQGKGWAQQLQLAVKQGLSPEEAARHTETMSLHEGLSGANVFLTTGSHGQGLDPASGAAFGAGFQQGNQPSKKKKSNQDESGGEE